VVSAEQISELRVRTHAIRVDDSVSEYVLRLVRQSRSLPSLTLGGSPRAAIMLLQAAKALALLRGKDYVTPDEVQVMAIPVLRHRVRLTPEAEIEGLTPDSCLQSLLAQVDIPR
jgi:MoxR-like ATPase